VGKAFARTIIAGIAFLAWDRLGATVLKVPADHPTIALAVSRASDGDTVLVDDGVYLESNIEITKDIQVRSKNFYGAVVYGANRSRDAIFIVRAAALLEGFVLKGGQKGILQRGGPDVEWRASRLAIIDCRVGIEVNDPSGNIGSARVRNVTILGRPGSCGITTNDARRIDVSDCLVANCGIAFQGYDHISFRVSGGAVLDCGQVAEESTGYRPIPPATSRIEIGGGLRILGSDALKDPAELAEFMSYLGGAVFGVEGASARSGREPSAAFALIALVEAGIASGNGSYGAAAACYGRALAAAREAGSEAFSWQALLGLARAAEADGRIDAAIAAYREAIELLERWIPAVPMGLHRIDFLADKAPAFEGLIGLLLDERSSGSAAGREELAFGYSERLRALTRPLSIGAEGRGAGANSASLAISDLQRKLQDPDLSGEAKEALLGSLERAEQDCHEALVAEERRAALDAGRRRRSRGPGEEGGAAHFIDFQSVRDRLDGRAVLSYILSEKESFAFLATEAGLEVARLPAASRITALIEPYLRFLQLEEARDFGGAKAGRLLFDLLVGPFAAKLVSGPRRIIVVPDDRLHYLPFEALVASRAGDGDRPVYWGESVEITYAASVACALESGPWIVGGPRSGGRGAAILAVGCSDGIRCDNRSRQVKRFFQPLAYVRREVGALARIFGDGQVTALIDEETSETRLKAMDLSKYAIIHLAAHGVIDDTDWWRSALLLRPDAEGYEDGFLTALEISRLEIGGALVVLSGCGTGIGRLYEGEGIRGLSGAFRRAGADHLVVSLWNVDDRATAALMEEFYRDLAAGSSAAEALAGAKRRMIRAGYRNPFYWAPFVLIACGNHPPGT